MVSFTDLPLEIRDQIWALTVEPRVVPVRVKLESRVSGTSKTVIEHLISSTPVPKTLHICREGRSQNVYEKLFLSNNTEAAYVWVNLDIDIIDIGDTWDYDDFKDCGRRIRRLKFEADNLDETWYHCCAHDLVVFRNLLQCFVLAQDGWESWEDAFHERSWSCEPDNLFIIDKDRGRMMTFPELERYMEDDDRWEKQYEAGIPVPQDLALATISTEK